MSDVFLMKLRILNGILRLIQCRLKILIQQIFEISHVVNGQSEDLYLGELLMRRQRWQQLPQCQIRIVECPDPMALAKGMGNPGKNHYHMIIFGCEAIQVPLYCHSKSQ